VPRASAAGPAHIRDGPGHQCLRRRPEEKTMMISMLAALQDNGLTVTEVIRDIPHDGPAIVIYAMLALFVGLVWAGSRKGASLTTRERAP
jgi:hypothetical protein